MDLVLSRRNLWNDRRSGTRVYSQPYDTEMRISPEEVKAKDGERKEEKVRVLSDRVLFLILVVIITFICVLG